MVTKFNKLHVPDHWQQYWSRYPQGYTILESLINWVSQVDKMVDNQNALNVNVGNFRKELDDFIKRFDPRLQEEVTKILKEWQDSGFLEIVIGEALQTQIDVVEEQAKKSTSKWDSKEINVVVDWGISDSVDQSTKFQSLVDSLPNDTTLFFPNKLFHLKGIIFKNKKNIRLYTYGGKIVNSDNSKNIFNFEDCDNVVVEGFTVDCTWATLQNQRLGQFISATNVKNLKVSNNKVKRGGISISEGEMVVVDGNTIVDDNHVNQYAVAIRDVKKVVVTNNNISHVRTDGIKISLELMTPNKSIYTLIEGNFISECLDDGIDTFSGGLHTTIANNFIADCYRGMQLKEWGSPASDYLGANQYARNNIVSNNQFRNNRIGGVLGAQNISFNANIIVGSNLGLELYGVGTIISECIIDGGERGILITDYSNHNIKDIVIANTILKNISGTAFSTDSGNVENLTINGCTFTSIGGIPILYRGNGLTVIGTKLMDYGTRGINYIISTENASKRNVLIVHGLDVKTSDSETAITVSSSPNIRNGSIVGCYATGVANAVVGVTNVAQVANSWQTV